MGQVCVVDVLEGGERGADDPLSCSHYALQGLPAGCSAAAVPHSDAAGQDALCGSTVEGVYDGDWCSGSFQSVEDVEALMSFSWPVMRCYCSKRGPQ